MPAESESQRRLFGMALSIKRGDSRIADVKDPDVRRSVARLIRETSVAELRKLASKD